MTSSEASVWILWHLSPGDDPDDGVLVGVYSSNESALEAVGRLRAKPGFRDHPLVTEEADKPGFFMNQYELGKDHWTEGYRIEETAQGRYPLPAWLPPDAST